MHAQVGFDFGAESAFAKATVDTDISDKAAVASATWFQRGAPACAGSELAGVGAGVLARTGLSWRILPTSLERGCWVIIVARLARGWRVKWRPCLCLSPRVEEH